MKTSSTYFFQRVYFLVGLPFLVFLCLPSHSVAQIVLTFDSVQTIEGWVAEGDGTLFWDSTEGNPGGNLSVADDATGETLWLQATSILDGDWSMATSSDSMFFDFIVSPQSGFLDHPDYLIEIIGAGGSAKALLGFGPSAVDVYERAAVSLDKNEWNVTGDWDALLSSVEIIRIRAEFISGVETVRIDNLGLTFTPIETPITGARCSRFNSLENWSFQEVGGVTIVDDIGNPGSSVRLGDSQGSIRGFAPLRFLGDWSSFSSEDSISLDLFVDTALPNDTVVSIDVLTLRGNGNEAQQIITNISPIINQWGSYSFAIQESDWTVTAGTWSDLMQEVEEIEVALEYIWGPETVYFDNFCIGNLSCPEILLVQKESVSSSLQAQQVIILDSVDIVNSVNISAPEVILQNGTEASSGVQLNILQDGCDN